MPNNLIKSYAEKSGKPESEVEKMWDEVKKSVFSSDNYEDLTDERKYAIVNGIVKKNLGLNEEETSLLNRFRSLLKEKGDKKPESDEEDELDLDDLEDTDGDGKDDEEEKMVAFHFQESTIFESVYLSEEGKSLADLAKKRGLKHAGFQYYKDDSGKVFKANPTHTDFVEVKKKIKGPGKGDAAGATHSKDLKNHKQLLISLLKRRAERQGRKVTEDELAALADRIMKKSSVKVVDGELKVGNKSKAKISEVKTEFGPKKFDSLNEANSYVRWLPSNTLVEFKIEWENGNVHSGDFVFGGSRNPISKHIRDFFSEHVSNPDLASYTKFMLGEGVYDYMAKFLDTHEIGDEFSPVLKTGRRD